jgi:RNA-directed DNA polymerase
MSFPREAFIEKAKLNHSDEFINLSLKYINKLEVNGFPVIFSIPHFAIEIGMQSDFINHLIENRNSQYTFFLLKKKKESSAPREIMSPKEELKFLQRWINLNILQKSKFNEYIQGFVPGTSTLKNAQIHQGSKYLLKIDLLKFFDCIEERKVYKVFRSFGYVKNLSWDFAKLCTAKHRNSYWKSFSSEDYSILGKYISKNPSVLPQGAPTSPLLANLVASRLDKRIGKLALKQNFKYSRYADDLCISSNEKKNLPSILFLTKIIEEEGFYINKEKIKYSKAGMKQYVTGLSITNGVSIEKKKRREIFTHLFFATKYGLQSHLLKLKEKGTYRTNYQNWLLGNISYQYSINKDIGKKMFELYNKINWSIDNNINKINVDEVENSKG